MNDLLMSSC